MHAKVYHKTHDTIISLNDDDDDDDDDDEIAYFTMRWKTRKIV